MHFHLCIFKVGRMDFLSSGVKGLSYEKRSSSYSNSNSSSTTSLNPESWVRVCHVITDIIISQHLSLLNEQILFITKCDRVVLQSATALFITKCDSYFIAKCDKRYYKVWQYITKVWQVLLQSANLLQVWWYKGKSEIDHSWELKGYAVCERGGRRGEGRGWCSSRRV